MSLVLLVHSDDLAVVGCDGRVSRVEPDGARIVVSDHTPKYSVLSDRLLITTTGRKDICDVVETAISQFAQSTSDLESQFAQLAGGVEEVARQSFDNYPVKGEDVEVNVALIGYDAIQRRMRCVCWYNHDNFTTVEQATNEWNLAAFGPTPIADLMVEKLRAELLQLAPLDANKITVGMRRVIEGAACLHEGINAVCFFHIIRKPLM